MKRHAPRPTRVLITADAVGGVWTHVDTLVRTLSAADRSTRTAAPAVDYTVAVLGPVAPPRAVASWTTPVHYLPCRLEWMDAPWDDVRMSGAWLESLARTVRPDVVHVNGYAHASLDVDAPVLVGAHSCVCSWWRAVHGTVAPPKWRAYHARVAHGLKAAAMVVAPTAAMLRMLEREYGPVARATVIHNGGAPHAPTPVVAKSPLVVSVGRFWDEAKNLRMLDGIAPALPWPVTVVGPTDGPTGQAPPPRSVHAVGAQPPAVVRQWLSRARIYVHPARYEPFGLSVLEAAQAGCALVLADLPSLREIWGAAAVYLPPDDQQAWTRSLRALIADASRVDELGAAAYHTAARYSAGAMADAYAGAYATLAQTPRERAAARTDAAPVQPGAVP